MLCVIHTVSSSISFLRLISQSGETFKQWDCHKPPLHWLSHISLIVFLKTVEIITSIQRFLNKTWKIFLLFTPIHSHTFVYWKDGKARGTGGTFRREAAGVHRCVSSPIHNLEEMEDYFVRFKDFSMSVLKDFFSSCNKLKRRTS